MGFVLRETLAISRDLETLSVIDSTQEYVDGDNYGWGQGATPINRANRALVCFVKLFDENGDFVYLDHKTQFIGSDKSYGVADGDGLVNTDKSVFSLSMLKDGHVQAWLYPIERDTTRVGGGTNEIYFNTDDNKVYIYTTEWKALSKDDLSVIEASNDSTYCDVMYTLRVTRERDRRLRRISYIRLDKDKKDEEVIEQIENQLSVVFAASQEDNWPTARKRLKSLETYLIENA